MCKPGVAQHAAHAAHAPASPADTSTVPALSTVTYAVRTSGLFMAKPAAARVCASTVSGCCLHARTPTRRRRLGSRMLSAHIRASPWSCGAPPCCTRPHDFWSTLILALLTCACARARRSGARVLCSRLANTAGARSRHRAAVRAAAAGRAHSSPHALEALDAPAGSAPGSAGPGQCQTPLASTSGSCAWPPGTPAGGGGRGVGCRMHAAPRPPACPACPASPHRVLLRVSGRHARVVGLRGARGAPGRVRRAFLRLARPHLHGSTPSGAAARISTQHTAAP